MTKQGSGTGERYREVILPVPVVMYDRIKAAKAKVTEMGLLPAEMTDREFILVVLANGVGLVETDTNSRERKGSLVVTPDEARGMMPSKSQLAAEEAKARWARQIGR